MSSFSIISSKATVAITEVVGEAIHHIRRLSSSSYEEENPFQSEMNWLPMLGIVLVVLAVCFFILDSIIRCIYPNPYGHHHGYFQPPPAQRILPVMSIEPALNFTSGLTLTGGADHPECTICLSEFVEGEKIRILSKCKHGFHDKCIETWLRSRSSCPTCRTSCIKTLLEKNPPENLQQQQQNDIDLEAANRPETRMRIVQQQQQPNDVDVEIANQPETEMVVLQQEH